MQPGISRDNKSKWHFAVWAPFAERVELIGADTDHRFQMEKGPKGYWYQAVDTLPLDFTYWYRLDSDTQRADPASPYQPQGVHGPGQIVDHQAFAWTDADYKPVELDDYIIYELHIGTFTPQGTFAAASKRLAELKEMGITAVEVMPVAQFPGSRNWGYDGNFPYAVQNSYGGPAGFKQFIDTAHSLGLAVILDVVYNHLGPEGNYLRDFGPYFTNHYNTPWGEAINFDQAYSDQVRHYFIENALYWLREYHIDALRLDALHAVFDMSAKHFICQLVERVRQQSKRLGQTHYLIGESNLNDVRLLKPIREGGYGLDAQWSDDFHHALHALLTRERFGYYQDFGAVGDLSKALAEGFVYDGQYSRFRKRNHGNSSRERPARQFVICAQNHDQVGNRIRGDRLSQILDFERLKLAAGCLLLSPYIPMLFMGEEYCEDNPFQYFVSMNDPDLVEAIRQGRAEEFPGFQWQGECPDPQAEETFQRSKLQWDKRATGRHKLLLDFYKTLIRLRMENPNFVSKAGFSAGTIDEQEIVYMRRSFRKTRWLCLMNFSEYSQTFAFPAVDVPVEKTLDSADSRWQGPGALAPGQISGTRDIEMPQSSISVYVSKEQAS